MYVWAPIVINHSRVLGAVISLSQRHAIKEMVFITRPAITDNLQLLSSALCAKYQFIMYWAEFIT